MHYPHVMFVRQMGPCHTSHPRAYCSGTRVAILEQWRRRTVWWFQEDSTGLDSILHALFSEAPICCFTFMIVMIVQEVLRALCSKGRRRASQSKQALDRNLTNPSSTHNLTVTRFDPP